MIADIARLPLSDQVFDVALCTEVIEHVPEPIVAIGEIARILRPGGELLLTAPLGSGLHQFPFHYYGGFTPHWYRVFLQRLGFTDIRVEPNGGFFKHYGQESQRFNDLVDPRQFRGIAGAPRMFMGLLWLASFSVVPRGGTAILPFPRFCRSVSRFHGRVLCHSRTQGLVRRPSRLRRLSRAEANWI